MKALLLLLLVSFQAKAQWGGLLKLYGDDNRKEVSAATRSQRLLADASAALIPKSYLIERRGRFLLDAPTLQQSELLCEGERYREQPAASICSGILIAPDLVLTASHCYNTPSICEQASWVFGYHEKQFNRYEFRKKEVYGCKETVFRLFDVKKGHDFVVVKLDREVKGRTPVTLRTEGAPAVKDRLVLIGNPRGLPTKIADDAWITKIDGNILMTNVDAYTGNSGSGVFNADTGFLEGILSFGKEDFEENEELTCFRSRVYKMEDGSEAVMRIGPVAEFLKSYKSHPPKKSLSR